MPESPNDSQLPTRVRYLVLAVTFAMTLLLNLICDLVKASSDKAEIVGLDEIARRVIA